MTHSSLAIKRSMRQALVTLLHINGKMGSRYLCESVYFSVAFYILIVGATQNTPESIIDGVIISGGTSANSIRGLKSMWTLHVVVGQISTDNTLDSQISRIHNLISAFPSTRRSDRPTSSYWQQRLNFLRPTAPLQVSSRDRRRRGLIDVGGELLHQVFGVATSKQVETNRRMIQLVRASNKQIIHQSNKMVTVINQTYHEIISHRRHIQEVEKTLSELFRHIKTWISLQNVALEQIRAGLRIDRCLSLLESAHFAWNKLRTQFLSHRSALESGRLSETLLPTGELSEILRHSHVRGYFTPHVEWYYEFVKISPLWRHDNELIFVANIPLAGHTQYLRYNIATWPFLHTTSNIILQFEMPSDIAYDTKDGLMFTPNKCVGKEPQICHTGPVYGRTHFSCIRGVLTNNAALRDTCKITIHRNETIPESVLEIHTNVFLIVSGGGTGDVFCEGKPSETVNLPIGTSIIRLSPHCRLTNNHWMITGIMSHNINITLSEPSVAVTAFNWSNLISRKTIYAHLASKKWRGFPAIHNVSLKQLQLPVETDESIDWLSDNISSSYKWPLLFFLIFIISTALLVISYKNNWFRFVRTTPPSTFPKDVPNELELKPLSESTEIPLPNVPLTPAECVSMLCAHAEIIASE